MSIKLSKIALKNPLEAETTLTVASKGQTHTLEVQVLGQKSIAVDKTFDFENLAANEVITITLGDLGSGEVAASKAENKWVVIKKNEAKVC